MSYTNYYPSSGMFHASLPQLMGTRMDALLFGESRQQLEAVWERAEVELKRLETMLNRFDPTGETAKINREAAYSTVALSDELWMILLDCRRYFEATNGYFDITLSHFENVRFVEETHGIQFNQHGMSLDFGGYAKGYALKILQKQLEEADLKRVLINFGNSAVLGLGAHPFGNFWPIGIDDPFNGTLLMTISLCDSSLSVSGNTPSNKEHIVNPKTTEKVAGQRLVAIVADDPVDAEALTTAWIASGETKTPEWMQQFNLKNTYNIR